MCILCLFVANSLKRMVRLVRLLTVIVLLALAIHASPEVYVVIMHTNDLHGQVLPGPGIGGSAALATIVRNARPDLMLDAGDMFSGTMISDTFKGEPVVDVMNAIGYDAAAIGNHEFNFGLEALEDLASQANFPFLSANIITPINEIHDAAIFNAQGIRIAVIGATTGELRRTGHPRNLRQVQILDVVKGIENALLRVRDRADFIVLLTHTTDEEEARLARAFPEIRLIVGGHEDTPLREPLRVGETMIVRAGKFGQYVGRIDLTFDGKKLRAMEARLIPIENVEPDPQVQQILQPYETKVRERLSRVWGRAAGDLSRSLITESHVGNLVADALRAKTRTQITLNNVGSVRIGIPKGPITGRTLFELVPFENTLITMKLPGTQIKRILSRTVMNVSGVRVRLDPSKPAGERLIAALLDNGKPIRDTDLYTVTTNDFLLAGGDGFTEFAEGLEIEDTGVVLRDAVAEHISRLGTVKPRLDGRIRIVR